MFSRCYFHRCNKNTFRKIVGKYDCTVAVVLAGNKEDLEYMTRKLKETYEKWGLDVNSNKTKYLYIGGNTQQFEIRQT
jgi:hypothetical protein